jgi:lipopolysaccharide heptosyltransferase II
MNILVLKPSGLGDVLMTTPLLGTLRAAYPDARIDYAVGDGSRPGVITNPDVDEVLPLFDADTSRLRRLWRAIVVAARLRWRRYDVAFIPDRSAITAIVAYVAGVPRRFGIAGGGRTVFLTSAVPDVPGGHDVDIYLTLARAAGVRDHISHEMKYLPTQQGLVEAIQFLKIRGFDELPFRVALFPGLGDSPGRAFDHRRWPAERYAILANQIIERHGGGVILLGDARERELNFGITNDIGYPVLDLTGRTDMDVMAAVMQLCDAVITNDSAPMHLAVSVGTPTVGIFGPTAARNSGPYGSLHRAVQAHIYCGPCARMGGPMNGCGAACIQRITVQDLVTVVEARAG